MLRGIHALKRKRGGIVFFGWVCDQRAEEKCRYRAPILADFSSFVPAFFICTRRDLFEHFAQVLCFLHLYEHVQHSNIYIYIHTYICIYVHNVDIHYIYIYTNMCIS